MFIYLGEDSQEFKSLVKESIVDNSVDKLKVTNEQGVFEGYSVKKGNVEGYAYYNHQGNFYEFAKADICNVKFIETLKVPTPKIVQFSEVESSYKNARNEETKMLETHKLGVLSSGFNERDIIAKQAVINEENGYIYAQKTLGAFSESQDVTKNYFVPSSDVKFKEVVSSEPFYTYKERREMELAKEEQVFQDKLKSLEENFGITFKDLDKKPVLFDSVIHMVERNNLTKEDVQGEYVFSNFSKEIFKINYDKKLKEATSKLKSTGIDISFEHTEDSDVVSLVITNKQGKEISKLTTNEAYKETVDLNEQAQELYHDEKEYFAELYVLDLDNESGLDNKKVTIVENGKEVSLEDSKFSKLYASLDDVAYHLNPESDFPLDSVETIDGGEYEIAKFDITDPLDFKSSMIQKIEENPELKKEIKAALNTGNKYKM